MNQQFKITCCAIILGILFSCNRVDKNNGRISHPTQENLLPKDSVNFRLTEESENVIDAKELSLIESIGIQEGSSKYMIGRVTSAKISNNSEIFVLDGQYGFVRRYDIKTGEYVGQFGRSGSGPSEFTIPNDLFVRENKAYVSDRVNRVQIFNVGNRIEHSDELNVEFVPISLCVIDNSLFISGVDYKSFLTVHKFNLTDNKRVMSFHEAYKSDGKIAKILLSNNKISCNQKSKTVAVISPNLPYIYGYDLRGNIKWISQLSNYNPILTTEETSDDGRPSINKKIDPNGYTDSYYKLIEVENTDDLMLQVSRSERRNNEFSSNKNLTYLIDSSTGKGVFISDNLPVIEALNKNYVIARDSKKYPSINIYKGIYEKVKIYDHN